MKFFEVNFQKSQISICFDKYIYTTVVTGVRPDFYD